MDDNLLACSETHIRSVFDMLRIQEKSPVFSGGLETAILKDWHAQELRSLRLQRMYFAYDTPNDRDPLYDAGKLLRNAGFTVASHTLCCYVLIGYPRDSFDQAETRLIDTIKAGFMPFATLYKDETGETQSEWRKFQREWVQHQIVGTKMKEIWEKGDY